MSDGIFTFSPQFQEFLPVYKDVTRVWIGNGINTGISGMLYAEYNDGHTAQLGSVSLYQTAVENGYTGTESQWLQMIMGVADLVTGSNVSLSYQISEDGQHIPTGSWSATMPAPQQGKYTWTKIDLEWIDGNTTSIYISAYQGKDGEVRSVNGEVGDILLYGTNLPISSDSTQSIKDYIDSSNIPDTATDDQIDALFSSVAFSGAAFITGRKFEQGDSITFTIEPVTQGAPMPTNPTVTVYPTDGNSCRYAFNSVRYRLSDIPEGQTSATFEYKISESAHTLSGVSEVSAPITTSVRITDNGNGTIRIAKADNYNSLLFMNKYIANGRLTFSGTITLNGRSMAAREFMVEIKEGDEVIATNISTIASGASGEAVAIVFPAINYTLDDVGVHVYTVRETSLSGDGVTISNVVYTVRADVRDDIHDAELEIITNDTEKNLDFVNTYEASGIVWFEGIKSITNRRFLATDTYSVSVTSSAKLPSPSTVNVELPVGQSTVSFEFNPITYTLTNMRNALGGYDDVKTFVYTFTETTNIPGVVPDGIIHTVSVKVTDNKHGQLITEATYSDGEQVEFGGIYYATGSISIYGRKTLVNRNFVASDTMSVTITSNNGKLPYVSTIGVVLTPGQNVADFNFMDISYNYDDLSGAATRTFNYVVSEETYITGATNDGNVHTVNVQITDNYDGTLEVVPTYNDGTRVEFESIYDATGFLGIIGTKSIVNRQFKAGDSLSVTISSTNGGKLPNPATISVPITANTSYANFNFAQITYKVADLGGLNTRTFNYVATETSSMAGTSPVSTTDVLAVTVSDNADGTLSVVPSYSSNDKLTFTNVYSAEGTLSFKAREVFTNGDMSNTPFSVRVMQVSGNGSITQATENVVLSAPVIRTASTGNTANLDFTDIVTFEHNSSKDDTLHSYWFMLEQVLPNNLGDDHIYNNVRYDTTNKWINVNVSDNLNGTLTVTKDTISEYDIIFTNEQLANLTINKAWTGDYARLTSAQMNPFTFAISGPTGYSHSFAYADMVNNSKTIEHLSLGEYTVIETNNNVENFTITTSYEVNHGITNVVNVAYNGNNTVIVTDNVNKLEGSLTISKVWSGDAAELTTVQKNAVIFNVTGPKQVSTDAQPFSATFTYADMVNNSKTFEQLTLGTYTVTETNAAFENFDVTTTYSVDGTATNSAVIGDAETKTIVVTNDVNKLEASLTITKAWAGDEITTAQKNAVTFTVTGPKQHSSDVSTYSNTFTYENMTNGSLTIDHLTLGAYTVTESNYSVTDYDAAVSYIVDGISTNNVVLADGNSKTIAVTDTYAYHTGSVKISKVFDGITSDLIPSNFQIANNYNESVFTLANADNAATADGIVVPYEWTINNIPVHTTITFTESNEAITNYTLSPTSLKVKTSAEVIHNDTVQVSFANSYTRDTGSVKVTKQFSGIENLPSDFNIANNYNDTVFTYANADNAATADGITIPYEWTITNVPTTTVITFTENNYNVTGYNIINNDFVKSSSEVEKDETTIVSYSNSYVEIIPQGTLNLSAVKTLTGRQLEADEFTFVLRDAEDVTLQTKTNTADGSIVFNTITYGASDVANSPITYRIFESVPATPDPYITYDEHIESIEVTLVNNGDGTITATPNKNGNEIAFENEYTAP